MALSTKQKILNASIDLFSEKGFAETSIRDIANNVGIKTSSIYYHFESKEAILQSVLNIYLEVVNYDRHYKKWQAEKDSIISGEIQITADKLMSYMFFYFDEADAERNLKMIKIICNEAVKNDTVRDYQRKIITSGYSYIKDVLDILLSSEKLKKHNTAKLATALYTIAFAFMRLSSINMRSISDSGQDMMATLQYVLKMALDESLT